MSWNNKKYWQIPGSVMLPNEFIDIDGNVNVIKDSKIVITIDIQTAWI